jgi:TolA-binding protein
VQRERAIGRALIILSIAFITSCAIQQEEPKVNKLRELEMKLSRIEERQQTIEEQLIKTNERIDNLSKILSDVRVEQERIKVEQEKIKRANRESIIEIASGETKKSEEKPAGPETEEQTLQPSRNVDNGEKEPPSGMESRVQFMGNYEEAYRKAHELYTLKRLYEARDRFLSFIKDYPPNKYTDNAYFWVGKIFHELGDIEKAEAVYKSLIKKCESKKLPDCNKAPGAYMMLARINEEKGNYQEAKRYYDLLVERYPMSEEAFKIKELRGE